jgi:hypothetical protein
MMYGRRRRTLGALGAAAMIPACVASPSAEREADAAPSGGQGGAGGRGGHGGAPVLDTGLTGGTQRMPDAGPIGGTQPVPDAGPSGGTQPVPDAGPSCAPAVQVGACIGAEGEPLPYEAEASLQGEVTAIGGGPPENCDFQVWGGPSGGESVTFQVTEASGRILDVQIEAGGLDAYLAAHPLAVGEPVQLDVARRSHEGQGETSALRWLRGEALAALALDHEPLDGVSITPIAEVAVSEGDCCRSHDFSARIAVGGAEVELAPGCSTVAAGLTISNVSYSELDDLGCCNALGGPVVSVVARP